MGYIDSNFVGSKVDMKSTSWYFTFYGCMVLLSSIEKYHSLHHAITKLSWLKFQLGELGFGPKESMVLFCDNTAAIEIANNSIQQNILNLI